MRNRRQFIGGGVLALAALVVPVSLEKTISATRLRVQAAQAGGRGNDGHGGRGGGSDGRDGNQGRSGGDGRSGNQGNGRSRNSERSLRESLADVDAAGSGREVNVRHANGTTESIDGDRYVMRDFRARTIVNRRATASDRSRLEALSR